MRRPIAYISLALFTVLSCCDDHDGGSTDPLPFIEFEDLKISGSGGAIPVPDSFILTLAYVDGDMDLGLSDGDTTPPYQKINYFLARGNGDTAWAAPLPRVGHLPRLISVKKGEKGDVMTHRTRSKPGYSFLQADEPYPYYECWHYRIDSILIDESDSAVIDRSTTNVDRTIHSAGHPDVYVLKDTFYYELNPHHYNMHIDLLVENSSGSFEPFPLLLNPATCEVSYTFSCLTPRFPRLADVAPGKQITVPVKTHPYAEDGVFVIKRTGPHQGMLVYKFANSYIRLYCRGSRFKWRITITDRALHRSNTVETPPMGFSK